MKYLLGIDFGGSASKATLINTNGEIVAQNTAEYPTLYPSNNACEQNPDDWIDALIENCKAIISKSKIDNSTFFRLQLILQHTPCLFAMKFSNL